MADAPFLCKFPDTGRFPKDKRPMPYDRRYLTVEGFITNIKLKTGPPGESMLDYIEVTIEEVCFSPSTAASSGGTTVPNSLDCELFFFVLFEAVLIHVPAPTSTPASRAKGRFINYGKSKNTVTPALPITPSPSPRVSGCTYGPPSDQAESSKKRARTEDLLDEGEYVASPTTAAGARMSLRPAKDKAVAK